MTDKYLSSMNDMTQSISIDPSALLTTSTINALHFPDLTTSGISDSGGGRFTNLNLDGVGMCESMTESYCEAAGQDEILLSNNTNVLQNDMPFTPTSLKNIGKKESINTQRKRRSRKAQYDASIDGLTLDKIDIVNTIEEQSESDDTWLFQLTGTGNKHNSPPENIISWVHKEFKENDINATKHRLLCKLDDMSHARTIRSISCHNFPANQRSDSVKRSATEQQVNPEPITNGRMISPLRTSTPSFNGNGNTRPTSPASSSPLRHTVAITNPSGNSIRSRDASREREREPLDYTDLEVMAKMQLENLRQAERQGPLSKRFDQSGTRPPVVPKSTTPRNGVKPNNHRRSNTQTISTNVANSYDLPDATEIKPPVATPITTRTSLVPPNNNRTRPPVSRPLQAYRGSQTSYNNNTNNPKVQSAPSSTQKIAKKPTNDLNTTFTAKQFPSNETNLLNDVSNKPLTTPVRSQIGLQRRTPTQSSVEQIPPSSSSIDMATTTTNVQTSIPRSSSSTLTQTRKSGIPTIGKQQRPSIPTATRSTTSNTIPSSKSSDNMMVTRNIRPQGPVTRPEIPDALSPTSSWNEGCY